MKSTDFISGIKSGYGFFYVETYEMGRCVEALQQMVEEAKGEIEGLSCKVWDFENDPDPTAAMEMVEKSPEWSVVILKNFNWFLQDATTGAMDYSIVQMIQNREDFYSSTSEEGGSRRIVVIVNDAPFGKAIPSNLEKQFLRLDFGMPNRDEIKSTYDFIFNSVKDNEGFKTPSKESEALVLDGCKGLTVAEIKSALSFSLVKHKGEFVPSTVRGIRDASLKEVAGIKSVDVEGIDPDKIQGMSFLKEFARKCIEGERSNLFKGLMLLGPPGTGKTTFFKWLAKVTGLPLYFVEVAELFGGLVGESEKLMKKLLDILPLLAPGIVVFDEIEKALAGMRGGNNDGGTTKRSLAQLLKFMSEDRPEGLYLFATCNDIQSLPPEWVRAGRWSTSPFFIDLPDKAEKELILKYYQKVFGVKAVPKDWEGWTGAEIEQFCTNTAMLQGDAAAAEKTIRPISKTMEKEISDLRKWAERRTIPATVKVLSNGKKPKKRAVKM